MRLPHHGIAVLLGVVLFSLGCGYGGSHNYTTMGGNTPTAMAPAISQLSPSSATSGGMGFILTANGSNFGTDATLYWNGTPRSSTYVTTNQVTAAISATDIASKGTATVYVRSNNQNSNTANFMIN